MDSERKKLYARLKHDCTRGPSRLKCVGYRHGRPMYEYDRSSRLVKALRDLGLMLLGKRKL